MCRAGSAGRSTAADGSSGAALSRPSPDPSRGSGRIDPSITVTVRSPTAATRASWVTVPALVWAIVARQSFTYRRTIACHSRLFRAAPIATGLLALHCFLHVASAVVPASVHHEEPAWLRAGEVLHMATGLAAVVVGWHTFKLMPLPERPPGRAWLVVNYGLLALVVTAVAVFRLAPATPGSPRTDAEWSAGEWAVGAYFVAIVLLAAREGLRLARPGVWGPEGASEIRRSDVVVIVAGFAVTLVLALAFALWPLGTPRDGRALAIAHEIRNPVTAARSLAQQLAREPATPHAAELALILDELERVERQVAALLRFARREEPRIEVTDLSEPVRTTIAAYRSRLEAAGVALAVDAGEGLTARADREQLRQVLVNLVENALDAMGDAPGERRLGLCVAAADGHLRLDVSDTGTGIGPDALAHVFEPFFSLKAKGTGLGLAIAKRTIDAHGGRIAVASHPGDGTTFRIELPAGA